MTHDFTLPSPDLLKEHIARRGRIVPLRDVLDDPSFVDSSADLPVAVGQSSLRESRILDLAKAPNLLLAGAPRTGVMTTIHALVASLLFAKRPEELKFVFIDPDMVEFHSYGNLQNHYLAVLPEYPGRASAAANRGIVTDIIDAEKVLRSLCLEMENRFHQLQEANVCDIKQYNEKSKGHRNPHAEDYATMPYLVIIADDFTAMTHNGHFKSATQSIFQSIIRLAQKGRAVGIHIVLSTQRPFASFSESAFIKTNFPTRFVFRVNDAYESRGFLDADGAEELAGKGEMLFLFEEETERIQGAYIDGEETDAVVRFIAAQEGGWSRYRLPEPADADRNGPVERLDDRLPEAVRFVVDTGLASVSALQRSFGFGYAKAARIMDQMEAAGIVGPAKGVALREVLFKTQHEASLAIESFKQGSSTVPDNNGNTTQRRPPMPPGP